MVTARCCPMLGEASSSLTENGRTDISLAMEEWMTIRRKNGSGGGERRTTRENKEYTKKYPEDKKTHHIVAPRKLSYSKCEQMSIKWLHYPTYLHKLTFWSFFLAVEIVFHGCLDTRWEHLRESRNIDVLWRFIHEHPEDPNVLEARRKIELLEYLTAVHSNTRYSYNLYLERYPESVFALEVRRRLEDLDFGQAEKTDNSKALHAYLDAWPQGHHASQAQQLLYKIYCRDLLSYKDPGVISKLIQSHPDIPCSGELGQLKEKLLFEQAMLSQGVSKLIEFVHTHSTGELVRESKRRLVEKQVDALLASTRFDRATEVIQKKAESQDRSRLMKWAQDAKLGWIRSSFEPSTVRSLSSDLEPMQVRELRQWANHLEKEPGTYVRLANATTLLREKLVARPVSDSSNPDPRLRWLKAKMLSMSPEEETADFLLDLLGDPFIEVRRFALMSLREVMKSLGVVRAETWVGDKQARLLPKARSGILLLKLAVLFNLSGRKAEALRRIEELTESSESPDLFALYLAVDLSSCLGRENEAATLAYLFSRTASKLAQERITEWTHTGGLSESENGWLTLRQLYGVINLWNEVLTPFSPEISDRITTSTAEAVLGPWYQQALSDLKALVSWFTEEEGKWARNHSNYKNCQQPAPVESALEKRVENEKAALIELIFSCISEAASTIRWVICCHPRPATRNFAELLIESIRFAQRLAPLALNSGSK